MLLVDILLIIQVFLGAEGLAVKAVEQTAILPELAEAAQVVTQAMVAPELLATRNLAQPLGSVGVAVAEEHMYQGKGVAQLAVAA